jgi:hypothetical protein
MADTNMNYDGWLWSYVFVAVDFPLRPKYVISLRDVLLTKNIHHISCLLTFVHISLYSCVYTRVTVTELQVERRRNNGSIPERGYRFFSSPKRSDRPWGPLSSLFGGYRGFFPGGYSSRGVKLTTRPSAEVKNECIYTSTPPFAFLTYTGASLHLIITTVIDMTGRIDDISIQMLIFCCQYFQLTLGSWDMHARI